MMMVKRRVFVIAGGDLKREEMALIERERDFVIAADAGAKKLTEAGILPHLAVGDFDTVGLAFMEELSRVGVPVEPLPMEKNETDLHYALMKAVEHKPDEVVILGALGGARLDHMLANVGLLEWLAEQGTNGVLHHACNRIRLLVGPGELSLVKDEFSYVSLIPVSEKVSGIVTQGLKYPLRNETLVRGLTRGISNELSANEARVSIEKGKCLVVESRDR
jgi:thiamine pyrophosphokinase